MFEAKVRARAERVEERRAEDVSNQGTTDRPTEWPRPTDGGSPDGGLSSLDRRLVLGSGRSCLRYRHSGNRVSKGNAGGGGDDEEAEVSCVDCRGCLVAVGVVSMLWRARCGRRPGL